MRITVRATGILRDLPPFDQRGEYLQVELPGPASLRQVIAAAGIDNALVMAVAMGGQRRDKDEIIDSDAELLLIPPLAGG